MKISVVNSWSQIRRHRKLVVFWFIYHFLMFVLCVTNILFFIIKYNDLDFKLSLDNILLTVVGFLFAFAGINIYSIFNTNIETEKEQIRYQIDKYADQLELDVQQSHITRSMFRFMILGQLIATAPRFNSQYLEWIAGVEREIKNFNNLLTSCIQKGHMKKFDELYSDIMFLLHEEKLLLELFIPKLKNNSSSFFDNDCLASIQITVLKELDELYSKIKVLVNYDRNDFLTQSIEDFNNVAESEPSKSLKKRLSDWLLATKALFYPQKTKITIFKSKK